MGGLPILQLPVCIRMSHVTLMNKSCRRDEIVMSHIWMSHVTLTNESCHSHTYIVTLATLDGEHPIFRLPWSISMGLVTHTWIGTLATLDGGHPIFRLPVCLLKWLQPSMTKSFMSVAYEEGADADLLIAQVRVCVCLFVCLCFCACVCVCVCMCMCVSLRVGVCVGV